ncbi:hypothetical protein THAOC_17335, partial [Thalassiosira oceanica]
SAARRAAAAGEAHGKGEGHDAPGVDDEAGRRGGQAGFGQARGRRQRRPGRGPEEEEEQEREGRRRGEAQAQEERA